MNFELHLDTEAVAGAFMADPVTVESNESVRRAFGLLSEAKQGGMMVCRDGQLVGIFSERDALRMMAARADLDVAIETVMTSDPVTLSQRDSVATAISKMSSGGYRRLPIVDDQNRPVGMMRSVDILHYLVEHFPQFVYTLPPAPDHGMQEREGA